MGKALLFILIALVALSFAPRVAAFGAGKCLNRDHSTLDADAQETSQLILTWRIRLTDMVISKMSLQTCSKLPEEDSYLEVASSHRLM